MQLLLPIKRWNLPPRHFTWFVQANSGKYDLRREFYALKSRLLASYAAPDGMDVQILRLTCRACGGSGDYYSLGDCNRCDGTGIYDIRRIILHRWVLNNRLFHCPGDRLSLDGFTRMVDEGRSKNTIEGLVTHQPVAPRVARQACLKLYRAYDPAHLRLLARCCRIARTIIEWIYAPIQRELDNERIYQVPF